MKKERTVFLGGITKEKYEDNYYELPSIEDVMNKRLDLSKYGTGLKKIYFVPMAIDADNEIHEEIFKYSGRRKDLEIHLKLNLDKINTVPEFLQQVAELFYHSISKYKKHRIKNFDIAAFQKDVEQLFIKKGWLKRAQLSQV